ncbi:MAG: DUF1028 domain-containing protein [Actinomycetes bacterium]
MARLVAADPERDHRQLGIVHASDQTATSTGAACMEWSRGVSGPGFGPIRREPGFPA